MRSSRSARCRPCGRRAVAVAVAGARRSVAAYAASAVTAAAVSSVVGQPHPHCCATSARTAPSSCSDGRVLLEQERKHLRLRVDDRAEPAPRASRRCNGVPARNVERLPQPRGHRRTARLPTGQRVTGSAPAGSASRYRSRSIARRSARGNPCAAARGRQAPRVLRNELRLAERIARAPVKDVRIGERRAP